MVKVAVESFLPLDVVKKMDVEELGLRIAYMAQHGSPLSRIEVILANGFAAVANTWGAKLRPADLLPREKEKAVMVDPLAGIKLLEARLGGKRSKQDGRGPLDGRQPNGSRPRHG